MIYRHCQCIAVMVSKSNTQSQYHDLVICRYVIGEVLKLSSAYIWKTRVNGFCRFVIILSLRAKSRSIRFITVYTMYTYYVYILTTSKNRIFYIGVTNNLPRRIYEHKNKLVDWFTKKYNLTKLVYYEESKSIQDVIQREKQLKNWTKQKKERLIRQSNPDMIEVI